MKRIFGSILILAGILCLYASTPSAGICDEKPAPCRIGSDGCCAAPENGAEPGGWGGTVLTVFGIVIGVPVALVLLFICGIVLLALYYYLLAKRRGTVYRRTQVTPEPLSDSIAGIIGAAPDTTPEEMAKQIYPKNNAGSEYTGTAYNQQ